MRPDAARRWQPHVPLALEVGTAPSRAGQCQRLAILPRPLELEAPVLLDGDRVDGALCLGVALLTARVVDRPGATRCVYLKLESSSLQPTNANASPTATVIKATERA